MGHSVHIAGGKPTNFLAKSHPGYIQVDYSNPQDLSKVIQNHGFDYVVPGCNDLSYRMCAQVNELTLGTGIDSPETTHTIHNKKKFREFAQQVGLNIPKVFDDPTQIPDCAVIVKPVDAFSGRGISIVEKPDTATLRQAIQTAQTASQSGDCVVEEFVSGQLYSHSAFLVNQQIVRDFVVIEYGSANPFVVDTSYVDTQFPATVLKAVQEQIEHLAQQLKLNDGLLHTQFLVRDGKFWLVETTRRCPGDLYSQLIELSTGFDYCAAYAAPFVNQPIPLNPIQSAVKPVLRHTVTIAHSASFEHIAFHHPLMIERLVQIAIAGEWIEPSPKSRLALLFAHTHTHEELHTLAQIVVDRQLYTFNG